MAGYRSISAARSRGAVGRRVAVAAPGGRGGTATRALGELDEVGQQAEPVGGGLLGVELGGPEVASLDRGGDRSAVVAGGDDVLGHVGGVRVDEVDPRRSGHAG